MNYKEIIIDSDTINSLSDFYYQVSEKIIKESDWGVNLDSLNDFITDETVFGKDDYIITIKNFRRFKDVLGVKGTLEWLESKLVDGKHPYPNEIRDKIHRIKTESSVQLLWMIIVDIFSGKTNIKLLLD